MQDLNEYAEFYLKQLKSTDWEDGYHGLIEADHGIIPILIASFRNEQDAALRAMLVKIVWQHRVPETVGFLVEALADSNPDIWKNALDGLVTIATPEAIKVLESTKRSIGNTESEKMPWIERQFARSKKVRSLEWMNLL